MTSRLSEPEGVFAVLLTFGFIAGNYAVGIPAAGFLSDQEPTQRCKGKHQDWNAGNPVLGMYFSPRKKFCS